MEFNSATEDDKREIATWFSDRTWPLPAVAQALPEICVVAKSEKDLLACIFLYTTDSSVAYLEWLATNPDISEKLGAIAVQGIMRHLQRGANISAFPIKMFVLHTKNERLASSFKKLGFRVKDGFYQATWTSDEVSS